jgi:hypothetical protein
MLPRQQDKAVSQGTAGDPENSLLQEDTVLEGIHASVDFLLEALAEDLNAPIPSKEPAFLYVANDRLCLVRSLVERLESARFFLSTVENHFGNQSPPPPK